jgi:S-formylglutathione hydrolase FrmB
VHRRHALSAALGAAALAAGSLVASPVRAAAPPAPHRAGAPDSTRGTVDTVTFWSQSLGIRKRLLVWLPPSYARDTTRRYPVAVYLHGLWGSETDWTQDGRLHETLDSLAAAGTPEMIVAMPDGDDSWYTTWNWLGDYNACRRGTPRKGESVDSYCVPWTHYDDYVAHDLVAHLDSAYRTKAERAHRGIAGLSMGGYGAVSLALAYPELFSAAASHSGLLSPLYAGPHPFAPPPVYATDMDSLRASWGDRFWPLIEPAFGKDTAAWWSRDPARRAARLRERVRELGTGAVTVPALFVDVGTEDELLDQSRAFRWELERLGIPVTYAEWPGGHTWDYWRRHAVESVTWLAERLSK